MSATAVRLVNVDDDAIADKAGAEQSRRSVRAHITRVSGRNTETGGRGLPNVAEIEIAHDDGRVLQAYLPALQSGQSGTAALVRPIERATFRLCPICLESTGDTKEHVPPKPLGGVAMTYTCSACNGGLGSRSESAMQDWFDGAFRISYTREGDPAHFGHNRVLYRQTTSGEFVLLHEKSRGVLGDKLSAGGTFVSHQAWPHPNQYKTGLLKNAYLAACLSLRGVPGVESANEIRAELIAARDASSRAEVKMGERARGLKVYRTGGVASGPPLALVRTVAGSAEKDSDRTGQSAEQDGEVEYLISLAGTLLVAWPFPEIPATAQFEAQAAEDSARTSKDPATSRIPEG